MILFEAFLTQGDLDQPLLSDEVLSSTGAAIMTPEQAELVGLEGVPPDPDGRARLLIACQPADQRLITSRLEAHPNVGLFKLHQM